MKQKHKRLVVITILLVLFTCAVGFVLYQLKDSLIFFYSPTELKETSIPQSELIRVGGLVKKGSVHKKGRDLEFVLTDYKSEVTVHYTGIVPQLFREGQGMVAVGNWIKEKNSIKAKTLLAKHDENYMPREVMEALKEQGHWQGNEQ